MPDRIAAPYAMNTVCMSGMYSPAVWWVSRQIRREREYCYDEIAVNIAGSNLVYAKALAILEERRISMPHGVYVSAHGGDLSRRIARVLTCTQAGSSRVRASISLVSMGLIAFAAVVSISVVAIGHVAAQTASNVHNAKQETSERLNRAPDLSCTFYDKKLAAHPGTCEENVADTPAFYCRRTDRKKLRQPQASCEQKIQQLHEWESQQNK